ncbi:MAG: hypothetical protein MJ033_01125 [Victivallaceae bacterium]|nr:hypothetical protein [Victivallaceae bacterium]
MNRFVKKNQMLVTVLAVAAVIVFALLIYSGYLIFEVSVANSKTEEFADSIRMLRRSKPAPVKENRAPIQEDAKTYRQGVENFFAYFDRPYQHAADRFLITLLNLKDEAKLPEERDKFIADYRHSVRSDSNANTDFTDFRDKYNQEGRWKEATEEFKKAVLEVFPDVEFGNDADRFALVALGLPYRLPNVDMMQRYYDNSRERFGRLVKIQVGAQNFGFDPVFQRKYNEDDFPLIVYHLDIIGDMMRRMKQAQISSLNVFAIDKGIPSAPGRLEECLQSRGNVRMVRYVFEVSGTLNSIRAFAEKLISAAEKERRFYVIKSLNLYANDTDYQKAREQINPQTSQSAEAASQSEAPRRSRREMRRLENQRKAEEKKQHEEDAAREAELKLPIHQRRDYGRILFGGNGECRAIFDVEYLTTRDGVNR